MQACCRRELGPALILDNRTVLAFDWQGNHKKQLNVHEFVREGFPKASQKTQLLSSMLLQKRYKRYTNFFHTQIRIGAGTHVFSTHNSERKHVKRESPNLEVRSKEPKLVSPK